MSWHLHRLQDLCAQVTSGGTPPTSRPDYYGGAIPWLRTQEVKFNRITDTEIKINEDGLTKSSAKWIPENSVIVAMYGNSAGRVAVNDIPLTTNQACCNLIIDAAKADYRFVYYRLMLDYEILHQMAKGAAQNNLNAGQIKAYLIRAPLITEQERIADILSAYDDLIENNQRRIVLLEEAAQQLYREWFVRLCFPGYEHVKIKEGVPEGWEKGTVADFFDTTSGGTPSRKYTEYFSGDINWVKTQELNEGFIYETEEKITTDALRKSSAKLFPECTLLVSIYGGTNIGRTGILAAPSASNQACVALIPRHPAANYIFAQLFFQSIRESLIGMAQGAAQTNISQQTLRKIAMVMPSESMMRHFLDFLSPVYDQMRNLNKQKLNLEAARDHLLPRLMNEEADV